VVICEILRTTNILSQIIEKAEISKIRIRSIYLAYIDLLSKLQLFREANQIVKASDDEHISNLSRRDVEIRIRCGNCRKDLKKKSNSIASATVWCENCRCCVSKCSFCDLPVTGLLQWCPICSHGGHHACLQKWFSLYNCCATGCGHNCCLSLMQSDRAAHELSMTNHGGREDGDFPQKDNKYTNIESVLIKRRQQLFMTRTRQLERLVGFNT
jgi:hypothetical protein